MFCAQVNALFGTSVLIYRCLYVLLIYVVRCYVLLTGFVMTSKLIFYYWSNDDNPIIPPLVI